jgi:hypothetical protein
VRVRVAASLAHDLLDFLRRCGCEVEQSCPDIIDVRLDPNVSVDAVLSVVRDHRCYACGGEVADVLAKLGSALCHDCRDAADASGRAPERVVRALWARMEVDAYLRVWLARHPGAEAALLDGAVP